jgi:preprotein translocase subunit SecG
LGKYTAVDDDKMQQLPAETAESAGELIKSAKQGALAKVTIFPAFMFVCYMILILYFKSKGGYSAVHLTAATDRSHPSHGQGGGVDRDVTADEAIADGMVGPSE